MTVGSRVNRKSDVSDLLEEARKGHRPALAWLLSDVERGGARCRAIAATAYRHKLEPWTLGITGAPGAGKSTIVGGLVGVIRGAVEQVAVVAIDPSSPFTGGAILGDRIRMQSHALDPGVFIRSMATRGHLGGLSVAVPEAIRVLGAAGFELVVVETVGVGQVEVEIATAADTTVVVLNPRWGDAVQANKAGLLEVADVFVINKADQPGARETRRDLEQMLDLSATDGWRPPIVETVASTGSGISDLWEAAERHRQYLTETGILAQRRRHRIEVELRRVLTAGIDDRLERLWGMDGVEGLIDDLAAHSVDPYEASDLLLGTLSAVEDPAESS